MDTVILKVSGMVCDRCVGNVERTITEISGVAHCDVSYEKSQAAVQYDPRQVDLSTIQQAIADVGFTTQRC